MELPKPTFMEIIEECASQKRSRICLVLNSRLYSVDGRKNIKDNLFYFINNYYALHESETLSSLEKIYFKDNKEIIKSTIDQIIDKGLDNKNKFVEKEIKKLDNKKYEIVKFVIKDIFALDNKKDEQWENKRKRLDEKIKNKILFKYNYSNSKRPNYCLEYLLNRKNSSLESLLENKNIIIFNNNIYDLKKVPKRIYNQIKNKVRINNSFYLYNFFSYLKDLETKYLRLISNEINEAANYSEKLQDNFSLSKEANLLNIAKRSNYEKNNLGFLAIENSNKLEKFYVYIKVNPFILKSPETNHYYKFEKCRVGVRLQLKRNGIEMKKPVVIDKYFHPLIPKKDEAEQEICYGGEEERNQINKELNDINKIGGKVHYFLKTICEPILRSGYHGEMKPYFKLTDENFGDKLISLEEIKKQDVSITN